MLIRLKKIYLGSFSYERAEDFLTSQWQREQKSFCFVVYRWIVAVFFTFSVACAVFTNIEREYFHVFFIYLTHLNLIASMITTLLGALLANLHFVDKANEKSKSLSIAVTIYAFLWNQSVVLSCLVSMFYWGLIHRTESSEIDLNNILVHLTNSIVLIIDLMIVKHPPKYLNFLHVLSVEVVYLMFTIIYQFAGGVNKNGENFVYKSTDWINKPTPTIIYASTFFLISIVMHFVVNFIHKVRHNIHRRIQRKTSCEVEEPRSEENMTFV